LVPLKGRALRLSDVKPLKRIGDCERCGRPWFEGCSKPSCFCDYLRERGQPCRGIPSGGTHPLANSDEMPPYRDDEAPAMQLANPYFHGANPGADWDEV
jgi:hypothetical protein